MVDGQFDKNTGAITLRATFPNPEGVLRNGNTGKIRLEKHYLEALLIPQLATIEIQDKIFVYKLNDDNKVSQQPITDRKSTRLNSSHVKTSYAVFCLK